MDREFTETEMESLRKCRLITKITPTEIIYGEIFEYEYYLLEIEGHSPSEAFDLLGLDPDIVGQDRIITFHNHYIEERKSYIEQLEVRPLVAALDEIEKLREEQKYLEQERDFLIKRNKIRDEFYENDEFYKQERERREKQKKIRQALKKRKRNKK
ncbi:HTH domain-containing protein [Aliicoccus persicus]|uniref:Uncharacterized protein n=1 Tax=Aliicoccus persicus TaxID=930138 RepID=A0A662Z2G2_9STAP|nr:HTH domain-containing protein [Aliicoccus persicus]SEV80194.1 hypothetical protein SAMN05192557_0064 [Aliicoccus persicus]